MRYIPFLIWFICSIVLGSCISVPKDRTYIYETKTKLIIAADEKECPKQEPCVCK